MSALVNIVKIGGNVIDDPDRLKGFLSAFAAMEGKKILVHGGGKEASRLSSRMGMEAVMVEGRRVTDRDTLDIVTMVYAGLINKRIVAMLQSLGCDAVGLTGADGDAIPATRRDPVPVDYGYVGDIDPSDVNAGFISRLLDDDMTPVFCAICHDSHGTLLNCNADSVASAVALASAVIHPSRLTYCFEMPGVLSDIHDPDSVIPLITPGIFEDLKGSGAITAGMIPKLQNALTGASRGLAEVRICNADDLLSDSGTFIRAL